MKLLNLIATIKAEFEVPFHRSLAGFAKYNTYTNRAIYLRAIEDL